MGSRARAAGFAAPIAGLAAACMSPPMTPPAARLPAATDAVIYAVDGGWHTELGLPAREAMVPVPAGTRAVALGFGARGWYMAEAPESWDGVRAVLGGPGVVLVRPLPAPPEASFDPGRTVALAVAPGGMAGLRAFLARTLAPAPVRLADGPYPRSAFYATETRYGLAYTCNAWVVDALRAAGLPADPRGVVTASRARWEGRPKARFRGDPESRVQFHEHRYVVARARPVARVFQHLAPA